MAAKDQPKEIELQRVTIQTTLDHARSVTNDAVVFLGQLAEDKAAEVTGHLQAGEIGHARYAAGQLSMALEAAQAAQGLSARYERPAKARQETPMGEKNDEQD